MIKNFDKETCRLSEYEEKSLLPFVVAALQNREGKENAITNKQLLHEYLQGCTVTEARLRKIINYIRNTGKVKCLMATNKGYFIARSREELETYIESLEGRTGAIKALTKSIRKQMNEKFPVAKQGKSPS
jgi:hypothetical protein